MRFSLGLSVTILAGTAVTHVPGLPPLPEASSAKLAARDAGLDLDNIQHDILVGMLKKKELFFFFHINDAAGFKTHLTTQIHPLITSTAQILSVDTQPLTAVNIAFSASGLTTLGVDPTTLNMDVFNTGQFADISALADPGTEWVAGFKGTTINGVFILQSDTVDNINTTLANIQTILGNTVTEVHRIDGAARPDAEEGHEHFGFLDGISQPAVTGFNNDPLPGQLPIAAGQILLGEDNDFTPRPAWAKDASFLAFRQFEQRVPEFNKYLSDNALNGDAELLGARMVGRWKSGAPIDVAPTGDDPVLAADNQRNNLFDFTHAGEDLDTNQSECPFAAHIRKGRADLSRGGPQDPINHIFRASIPYGPEVTAAEQASGVSDPTLERGLAFVAYQSDFHAGFRLLQSSWANTPSFAAARVPLPGGILPGWDPVIGANEGASRNASGLDPQNLTREFTFQQDFVVSRGGEYFLTPPISALLDPIGA
ncbi:fungal peroxidase [Mycena floridula]|nr:fungal peroxidase [Mycena floridula]